jgi:hypothetical protein
MVHNRSAAEPPGLVEFGPWLAQAAILVIDDEPVSAIS